MILETPEEFRLAIGVAHRLIVLGGGGEPVRTWLMTVLAAIQAYEKTNPSEANVRMISREELDAFKTERERSESDIAREELSQFLNPLGSPAIPPPTEAEVRAWLGGQMAAALSRQRDRQAAGILVHRFEGGLAACGQPGRPSDWPPGDLWIGNWALTTCSACLEKRPK